MSGPYSGKRVLVVEDEFIVSWNLIDMLGECRCTIVGPAASFDQALAMIDAEDFDAVLLDINLNGRDSYPLADRLMARGARFAFSSGYEKASFPEAYRLVPLLHKPFERGDLTDLLAVLLAHPETDDGGAPSPA